MPPLVNKTKTNISPLVNKNRNGIVTSANKVSNDKNNKTRTSSTRASRYRWRLCEAPQQILEKVYSTKETRTSRVSPSIRIAPNDVRTSKACNSQNFRSLIVDNFAEVQPVINTSQINVQESSMIFNAQNLQTPIMDSFANVETITNSSQENLLMFNTAPNLMNKFLVNKQELLSPSSNDAQASSVMYNALINVSAPTLDYNTAKENSKVNDYQPIMANNVLQACSQHQRNNRKSLRKQPYPQRAPDSSSEDGYVIRVNIYEVYKKNPKLLSKTLKEVKKVEKKDENPFILELDELIVQINDLDIDHLTMNFTSPKITWKKGSSSLDIRGLEGANRLHKEERELCSKLRMQPLQYLRGKLAILRGARKARKDNLKFKKVDAQRLVNFDVNKACKLWEFFDQLGWI
ncbi:hypothetical protein RhiirA5_354009 [Rhizophagus irregularis]|uniref:SWIRM domain-containing protein n=5 Tax=Rhizophagus irregularis TaxID=588596 RepID=A0A2I1DVR0_9GLOM|nr:Fun19p [Rhizophagus irregularis DAOM 197198w]PKC11614.1 hypothetical protein RhiirA5_354009 [Rhizophagus irregularis]GBC30245.1 homeodomain-like protein [Rhizophagus irregularis DAOM 181602=DAOM 197198]PKC61604.1 hypothetical protein RhiirA1_424715 [Rhizophagus irregularis]PKY13944.1 hypothetical protein RhiirB3_399593 [Rhizophagus irregularis]